MGQDEALDAGREPSTHMTSVDECHERTHASKSDDKRRRQKKRAKIENLQN